MTRGDAPRKEEAHIRAALTAALPTALPGWLESRRWFADKGRGITGVELQDVLVEPVAGDWLALTVARVAFKRGDAARYLVPVAWTMIPEAAEIIVAAPIGAEFGVFVDATETVWFGDWLFGAMTGSGTRTPARWSFASHAASAAIDAARGMPATLMRGEQSNTSLRFGDALMVKLFRRLQPGPNPDAEMLSALAGAGFERVPPYAGAAAWYASEGEAYPIALAQAFVPNLGDGWSWMLQRLADISAGTVEPALDNSSPEWLLGRRTAELHVALSEIDEPGFAVESTSDLAIADDVRRTRDAIGQAVTLLRESEARLPESLRTTLPQTIAELQELAARAEGFRHEASTRRIRVHGDFHLGQTLRTRDGDWTIIDFEGEPARPVAERRQKSSALKDVAGMLRSFAYARGAVARASGARGSRADQERLSAWETNARRMFLEGYRGAAGAAPVPLVPRDDQAFTNALAAWELDKALYEIAYEARNRPDWIELPLRSLLPNLPD